MEKSKQGVAVAIIAIGLIILVVGAGVLVSELRKERRERERLEEEAVQLRQEVESLKPRLLDLDGAGDLDIYVITPNVTVLHKNQGDGTFTDVQVQRSKEGSNP